jgi:hypothetical protein
MAFSSGANSTYADSNSPPHSMILIFPITGFVGIELEEEELELSLEEEEPEELDEPEEDEEEGPSTKSA